MKEHLIDILCFEYGYLQKQLELEHEYFERKNIFNKLNAINTLLEVRLLDRNDYYDILNKSKF